MNDNLKKKGRFLTLVLRHAPEKAGLTIDYKGGWAAVPSVLCGLQLSFNELQTIVDNDNKDRFTFNSDKTLIRANQGHSIKVDLELDAIKPPDTLYHGTVLKFKNYILIDGLLAMGRHHVHLSDTIETATQVASRRQTGNVILEIDALKMYNEGYDFFRSVNGVWLTAKVPTTFIAVKE